MVRPKKVEEMKAKKKEVKKCEFAKTFFSKYSSKRLCLPRAVVSHFHRITKPKDVALKNSAGRMWICKINMEKGRLVLKDGWQTFADHHSLEDGDFLTFSYNGDDVFDVKVYDATGLRTEVIETESENDEDEEEEEEEEEETPCESECSVGPSHTGRVKPKRYHPTFPQEKKACPSSSSGSAYLLNAHFFAVMKAQSEHSLHVSTSVVKQYGIHLDHFLKIRDENGSTWPVTVAFREDGRIVFTKGWTDFYRRKDLKLNDTCVFEFVVGVGSKKICKEVKVQIMRSGAAT